MSVNYYFKRKNTPQLRQRVVKLLEDGKFIEAKKIVTELDEGIHLGSSSPNWMFGVEHDTQYGNVPPFEPNKESLYEYIKSMICGADAEYTLFDEYGRVVTFDEIKKTIESHINGFTMESYYRIYPDREAECIIKPKEYETVADGIRFVHREFY